MPKILPIPDQMWNKLRDASKNIDYTILRDMPDCKELRLLGVDDTPILSNQNDILVILHLIAGITGKNIDTEFVDIMPPAKPKRSYNKRIKEEPKPQVKLTVKPTKVLKPDKKKVVEIPKEKDIGNIFF